MNSNKKSKNAPKPNKPKARRQKPKQQKQVKAPVAVGTIGIAREPRFKQGKRGRVTLSHEELVGDVTGSVAFAVTSYSINAGLASIFIWLSATANNYESYKFKRLRFRFDSACSTSQVGYVYLGVDFDPADPAPVTEQAIASYEGTKYGSVWTHHSYDCAKHNLAKRSSYFTRFSGIPAGGDIGLYDVGNLLVATVGNGGVVSLGKLWVEYEVELLTPQLIQNGVGFSQSSKMVAPDAFISPLTVVGNAPLIASANAGILTLTSTAPYQTLIQYGANGTGMTGTVIGGTATTAKRTEIPNPAGTQLQTVLTSNFSAPGQTLTVTNTATSFTNATLRLGQYNILVNA